MLYFPILKNSERSKPKRRVNAIFILFSHLKGEPEREEKRILGMVIMRGQSIISMTAEEPPVLYEKKGDKTAAGPGKAAPITRPGTMPVQSVVQAGPGINMAPKGLGQPAPANMMPMMMPPGIPGGVPPNLAPIRPPMPGVPGQPPMFPPGMQLPPGFQPNLIMPPGGMMPGVPPPIIPQMPPAPAPAPNAQQPPKQG
eukprot:TRINITY_DN1782_c0_g1_i4.p1 TRINITY_DN1782_c0_g1~~TRINITY_DN1782_c0_g1_i4.p1  ORF type:complete len:198 (-),score=38.34 TRINITY_DN1782_c0_g1_i4:59-652(-)